MTHSLTLAALGLSTLSNALPHAARNDKPQATLEWQECPELNEEVANSTGAAGLPLECASLSVPLDYSNDASEPLELSLFRIKATEEPVLGTVLYNPGGPGGTGAENLPNDGFDIVDILGPQYHIVSWDPRGTGKTIPFNCETTQLLPAGTLTRRDDDETLVSIDLVKRFENGGWENAVRYADACYAKMNETGQLISTAYTARDMMNIVDALGEDGMLRYWGLSYGTGLGNYFAAMFPDKIDRMMLDGNLNPHDYQAGHYGTFLSDADKALRAFADECIAAGPDCALVTALNLTEPSQIFDIMNALLEPAIANATSGSQLDFVTYALGKSMVYQYLYNPTSWPEAAELLVNISTGNIPEDMLNPPNSTTPKYNLGANAVDGIRASDALWTAESSDDILDQVKFQATVSKSFSDAALYEFTWASAAWKMKGREQYKGDFTAKTSRPILFVNGEFDPVTPSPGAFNASAGYEGSRVLLHKGYGHGMFNHPSECVHKHVRTYFMDGTLPDEDTVCEPDLSAWEWAAKFKTEVVPERYGTATDTAPEPSSTG